MFRSPALPPAQQRVATRAARARGLPSAVVGVLIGAAGFVPAVLPLLHR